MGYSLAALGRKLARWRFEEISLRVGRRSLERLGSLLSSELTTSQEWGLEDVCVQEIIRDRYAAQTSLWSSINKRSKSQTTLTPPLSFYYEEYQTWRKCEGLAH